MDPLTTWNLWPIVNTIGLSILALLFFLKTWRGQSAEIDKETIEALKRQVETIKADISNYQTQIQGLTLKIGEQSGIIKMQEATILKYEKILENRNPELTSVLGEIRDFMRGIEDHKIEVMRELKVQTAILKPAQS